MRKFTFCSFLFVGLSFTGCKTERHQWQGSEIAFEDGGIFSDTPEDVVKNFLRAAAAGDGYTDYLTAVSQKEIELGGDLSSLLFENADNQELLGEAANLLIMRRFQDFSSIEESNITCWGDDVSQICTAISSTDTNVKLKLRKEDGDWKINLNFNSQ
jgi:hypothetical protein